MSTAVKAHAQLSEEICDEDVRRFIAELAARGGEGRCYWNRYVWPAERAGLIRTRYEPVRTPAHRTRPIRDWCYRVTLTDAGWALADAIAAANDNADAGLEEQRQ